MITLKLIHHDFAYELSDILKMYFGKAEIKITQEEALACDQSFLLVSRLLRQGDEILCTSELLEGGAITRSITESVVFDPTDQPKQAKRLVKISMYKLLSQVYQKEFPWGILTGIRPIKILHDMMDKGLSDSDIIENLKTSYLMSSNRAELALNIAKTERKYIYPIREKMVSIYIGIPFCPSRCHYCSFTSNPIKSCQNDVQGYMDSLIKEIEQVSAYLKSKGIGYESVYIGGGTPTSISDGQLETLIDCVNRCFGTDLAEFTCEAGRPDTITREKLEILKKGHVNRLSINPQTMNDDTLKTIGRAHDTAQLIESFRLAREIGFDHINMDIILGLPGETKSHVQRTLEALRKLDPESITVHTMAIKRASVYNEHISELQVAEDDTVTAMMDFTKSHMEAVGMKPYYLYRQKHMLQNMENIGYSKEGFACIYNIQIIEEKQSNIAFGADAVSKVVFNDEKRIERQHNIKDVKLYIENVEKQIEKKIALLETLYG